MAQTEYTSQAHGSLVLSALPRRGGTEALVRAARWHNLVHRIGHHVPLVFVHDLGRLLTEGAPPAAYDVGEGLEAAGLAPGHPMRRLLGTWRTLCREIADTELSRRAASLDLADEVVAAIVCRILDPVLEAEGPAAAQRYLTEDLPLDPGAYEGMAPEALYAAHGGTGEEAMLRRLTDRHFQVITAAERTDLDTLRLVSLFAGDASLAGAAGALDLYRVLDDPAAADVIHFSLELLPQLFESRKSHGMQRFSVDGVAGVSRRGNPDQLVPSELAYPDDVFAHKVRENQLLYYGREAERESERRVHLVLVDASASMRGARGIFARGLALALVKKLVIFGEEVQLRFFDSRLHEAARITAQNFRLPYLLSYRSERGRNYGRVFRSLLAEVTRLRRQGGRQAAVYFVTHGQCHVPVPVVESLAGAAYLYGIFVLPDGELALDYLPLLQRHRVVAREDLAEGGRRRQAALEIAREVGPRLAERAA